MFYQELDVNSGLESFPEGRYFNCCKSSCPAMDSIEAFPGPMTENLSHAFILIQAGSYIIITKVKITTQL